LAFIDDHPVSDIFHFDEQKVKKATSSPRHPGIILAGIQDDFKRKILWIPAQNMPE
jgi:hypothetical protein